MFSSLLLLAHTLIAILLIVVVLLQRAEGGLGALGGGGGADALMGGASAADGITKATRWLFILFMVTSLTLAVISTGKGQQQSVVDTTPAAGTSIPALPTVPGEAPTPE